MPDCTASGCDTARLSPLAGFYRRAGARLPDITFLPAAQIPPPAHDLLVHEHDMTSTLERFHQTRISIRALDVRPDPYERQVVLVADRTGLAVEFGAIRIFLEKFPPEARQAILRAREPLGAILRAHAIPFVSAPRAFFAVQADPVIAAPLGIGEGARLHGRCNRLSLPDGQVLADIVEILPPLG